MKITRPKRIARSYRQKIQASPDTIFSLFCPVREARQQPMNNFLQRQGS